MNPPSTKILIVEHNSDDIELLLYELKSAEIDFISEIVQTEKDYRDALANFIPDIILSDFSLPTFDGPFALKIREENAAHVPFIFVSGTIGEEKSIEYIKNGVTDYVLKESLFTLPFKVRRALQESKDSQQKRKTEELVIQNEKRFRALIEKGMDLISLISEEGNIFYVSPSITALLGYKAEELLGTSVFDIIHPEDLPGIREQTKSILQDPRGFFFSQQRCLHKNGDWIWFEGTVKNMLQEQGINALVSNFRDISERKAADIKHEFDRNNLNALINNSHDLLWSVDRDFNLLTFNQPFNDMITLMSGKGLTKGASVLSLLFSDNQLGRYKNFYERAFAGEVFTEIEFTENPVEFWSEISFFPIRKGDDVIGTACHSRDITQRKKNEEELKRLTNRLLMATDSAKIGIWDWDIAKKNIEWDDAMCKLYGTDRSHQTPVHERWLGGLHPDDKSRVDEDIQMAIDGKKQYNTEFRIIWPDSSVHYIKATGMIEKDAAGNVNRMIGINWEITERKLYEIRLKELNEGLQMQAKALAESNAELEQFAYVASHDLQEPLRMVTSFLTQLEKKYKHIIDDKGQKYIDFAVDGAKRMRQIILDLLEFSRVTRMDKSLENVNLNNLIAEIQILFRKQIADKKAVITLGELPQISAHVSPVRQVFQNLIGNALIYSRKDVPPQISIAVKELENHWQFSIDDNGIGIDKDYFDKIFIIFQRLHSKDEFSGTGMGLALAKKIIENMGGRIWVESKEGEGSSFYFTLSKQH